MNLVTEVEEPFLFDELIKGFSKINIDLEEDDINHFVTINNETTEEYSESVLEEVEEANSEVHSTNMPGTPKDHLESNEEYFSEQEEEFEFEGFKPLLINIISVNTFGCFFTWKNMKKPGICQLTRSCFLPKL